MAFAEIGVQIEWSGKDENEVGTDLATGRTLVRINPLHYRPAEVDLLIGSGEKAERILGWKSTTPLEELCRLMVTADIERNNRGFSF